MSSYTRNITKTYEFDGDKITIKLRRLSRKSMMTLLPHLKMDEGGKVIMSNVEAIKFIGDIAEEIKQYIAEVDGLLVEGEAVCPARNKDLFDEIYEASYFSTLWTEVAFTLIKDSSIRTEEEGTEKKSDSQSDGPSQEEGSLTDFLSEDSREDIG